MIDSSYGWMSIWVEHFGEESVPQMFELVAMEHFEEFFELGDPKRHAWTEGGSDGVLLDTLEAMRAHLSTVRRDGAPIRMVEHEDRYELEFDPCGSGGRALRGDIVEGTPSRIQEPYNFGVIKGAYDWTDGKSGMCVYCSHCQQLYEQWTIDRSGIPFLVVDPPPPPMASAMTTRSAAVTRSTSGWSPFPMRCSSDAGGTARPSDGDRSRPGGRFRIKTRRLLPSAPRQGGSSLLRSRHQFGHQSERN